MLLRATLSGAPAVVAGAVVALAVRLSAEDDVWRRLDEPPPSSVLALCPTGDRAVWLLDQAGLWRIEAHEAIRVRTLSELPGEPLALAPAGYRSVYVLTTTILLRVEQDTVQEIALDFDRGRPASLALSKEGELEVRVRIDGEVAVWKRQLGRWTAGRRQPLPAPMPRFPGDILPLHVALPPSAGSPICAIEFRGELWVGSATGVYRRRLTPRFRPVELPGSTAALSLARAPDGSIWCGADGGVYRVDGDAVETFRESNGQTLGTVTACAVDRAGRVWIGSGSDFTGVFRKDGTGWSRLGESSGFVDAYVHSITHDPATGVMWFSVLNKPGGAMEAGQGAWIHTPEGFAKFPVKRIEGSLPSERVYAVLVRDAAGVPWFATLKGLAALKGNRILPYGPREGLRADKVWCLEATPDGALWLGYQFGHGVSRIARGNVRHFTTEDGLSDNRVWSIAADSRGVLWFATESGLTRFDGRRWTRFGKEQGLTGEHVWPLLVDENDSLWIGTVDGGLFHLVLDDDQPPRTRFLESDGGRIAWRGRDAWEDSPRESLRYRWRWNGDAWSDVGSRMSVPRPDSGGSHRLQVQAIDRFGNAELPPAELVVVVEGAAEALWLPMAAAVALVVLVFLLRRR